MAGFAPVVCDLVSASDNDEVMGAASSIVAGATEAAREGEELLAAIFGRSATVEAAEEKFTITGIVLSKIENRWFLLSSLVDIVNQSKRTHT